MRPRFKIFHHLHLRNLHFQAVASNDVVTDFLNPISCSAFRPARWGSTWCYHMHPTFSEPKTFLEIHWARVSITCYQPWMFCGPGSLQHRFQDSFTSWVHPNVCQKDAANIRIPPRTFTQTWAILPSSPTTAPTLLSTATKTLLTYAFDPHCLLFHPCFSPHQPQISILPSPLC